MRGLNRNLQEFTFHNSYLPQIIFLIFGIHLPNPLALKWPDLIKIIYTEMGLFSFLKNAGAALVGGGSKSEPKTPSTPAPNADDAMKKLADQQLAMRLTNHVAAMELKVDDLKISVDGDKATVSGAVPSQSEREKVILTIGNVAGIASVEDNLSVEKPEPEATFYEVKSGDTLSKISKMHYGSFNKYMIIFEANKPMLKDPDKIYPGQVLRIPPLQD